MATAFDTNRDVRKFIPWLKSQGFTTAIRYYTALASPKRMTRAEAEALVRQLESPADCLIITGGTNNGFERAVGTVVFCGISSSK